MSFLPVGLQQDAIYFLIVAVVGVFVIYGLTRSYLHQERFAKRVKALQERRAQLKAEMMGPRKRKRNSNQHQGAVSLIRHIVNKMNLVQKTQVGKINKMLINAGYRSKDAIFIYTFFQLILPIVFLAIGLAITKIDFTEPFAVKWKPFVVLGMAYLGLKLPVILVLNARNKRYYSIQKSLSDTLDLMLICGEAGLSLSAALDRVSKELFSVYPEMAEELTLTSIEIGLLPERKKALMNLVERVDIPEIRGIVNVLIQTEKYGTPLTQALRVLANEFRMQRMLRAEQKAARLPAIMTVPMIVFILPTLFIIIMTPAIINIIKNS